MNIEITDLDMILNYLETTNLEQHDDYTSEITYKDQKILYKHIKELQQENQQLKDELKSNPDTQITLKDDKGNKFIVIQTERIDMQEELNKTIQRLFDNWNKLKEYIQSEYKQLHAILMTPAEYEMMALLKVFDKMRELERGSDINDSN